MTKFGAKLEREKNEEFKEGYFQFNEFKTLIRESPSPTAFQEALLTELLRVRTFTENKKAQLFSRLKDLEAKWSNVNMWKQSGFAESDAMVSKTVEIGQALSKEVDLFIDFCALNLIGVQKVVKKYERHVGGGPSSVMKLVWADLDAISDLKDLEQLSGRSQSLLDEMLEQTRSSRSPSNLVIEFQTRKTNYQSIPDTPMSSLSQNSFKTGSRDFLEEEEAITLSWWQLLGKPLLANQTSKGQILIRNHVFMACFGGLLAGMGLGAFWTICEVWLTSWETALALLCSAFGAISGTMGIGARNAISVVGLLGGSGSILFSFSALPLNHQPLRLMGSAWLVGTCLGAWTQHLPRQMVNTETDSWLFLSMVALAPLVGSCFSAGLLLWFQFDVGVFALVYGLIWIVFTLVCFLRLLPQKDEEEDFHTETDVSFEDELDSAETQHPPVTTTTTTGGNYWKEASVTAFKLGVLGSLFLDRTVRTLVLLEVVSFYPSMWGEDFFLLSVGSLGAALIATRVPSWCNALMGCLSMFLLNGPGLVTWIWVEASCRSDLMKCTFRDAGQVALVLTSADILASVLFLLELSYLQDQNEQPGSTLYYASMALLLFSGVGRIIGLRL